MFAGHNFLIHLEGPYDPSQKKTLRKLYKSNISICKSLMVAAENGKMGNNCSNYYTYYFLKSYDTH